jgi:hypothetical protein
MAGTITQKTKGWTKERPKDVQPARTKERRKTLYKIKDRKPSIKNTRQMSS